jgi:hypothetical protein
LAGQLGLWREGLPNPDLVGEYLADHGLSVDWRDPQSLAETVAAMVRFLVARGYARFANGIRWDAAELARRLPTDELDWLDRDTLVKALATVISPQPAVIRESRPATPELRRLFAAAIRLTERLGRWSGARSRPDVLAAFLAAQGAVVDEEDRRALAAVVAAMIRFMAAQGLVRFPERNKKAAAAELSLALADPDWPEGRQLDEPALQQALLPLLAGEASPAPAPPALSLSPRLRSLLEDLLAALRRARMAGGERLPVRLDAGQAESPANVLRLMAALVDYAPHWVDDELVYTALRRLLASWGGRPPAVIPARRQDPRPAASGGELQAALLAELDAATETTRDAAAGDALNSPYVGVVLLWRAVRDANLPALFADGAPSTPFAALLLALALRWAGVSPGPKGEEIDPVLRLLCGHAASEVFSTREALQTAIQPAALGAEWEARWLKLLAGLRLFSPQRLHLFYLSPEEGNALVAGDADGLLWPLGVSLADPDAAASAIARWWTLWPEPATPAVVCDPAAAPFLPPEVTDWQAAGEEMESALVEAHKACRTRLLASLASLEAGQLGRPDVDLPLALVAIAIVRLWARWLRGFAEASAPYLLDNLVRRPGRLRLGESTWLAQLARQPLDMVLEMAGYIEPLERVSWLDGQRLHFQLLEQL